MSTALRPARAGAAGTLARVLRAAAALVAAHGALLWLVELLQARFPAALHAGGELLLWVLAVPALVLTLPFTSLLWKLGLMNAPGWFAWPRPLGVALAYAVWIAALLAGARLLRTVAAR